MIKINNKDKAIEELKNDKIENIFNIIPNLSDKVLDYMADKYQICEVINETFESKAKYKSDITSELLVLSTIQSRMKQQFSISEVPLALTSNKIIKKLKHNISYDIKEGLLKESNIRAILSKYEDTDKENINFNNAFIEFFNSCTKNILKKYDYNFNIFTLDCSVLDVNLENKNYEGSTITYKGGKKLRGYKIGALRGITPNGGVICEACMSTAKEHDFKMSKEMIEKTSYLKEGSYLLEDRGFLDIDMFKYLNSKNVNVIIPAKKNMEIYIEAVRNAKENNNWKKHPNSKRNGQEITLIEGLEQAWLSNNDKIKKPSKLKLDYKINSCVIKFEKEKNKKVLSDEEIISTDDKYAYACILTNDTGLTCDEIIRLYEMRPEIEEDFRQLKDFWGLNTYKSTKYNIISFVLMASLLGYNFYKLFTESEEGKEYIGKNLIIEEKHGLYIVKGVRTAIVTEHYFSMFEQNELLDLYADLPKEKRTTIKQYLVS